MKKNSYNYRYFNGETGGISCDGVLNGTLYTPKNVRATIAIDEGIEIIAPSVFENQPIIKKVSFPSSLKEVQNSAFAGCNKIEYLHFKEGVKVIGSRAFCDANLFYIELPNSVTEISSDAFPQNCIVSVGGEMPGYNLLLTALNEKQLKVDEDR